MTTLEELGSENGFLGLRTLTSIKKALQEAEEQPGEKLPLIMRILLSLPVSVLVKQMESFS